MKCIFLFASVALLYSCQSGANKNKEMPPADSSVVQTPAANKSNGFAFLKGTIGTYPVTLYLYMQSDRYLGYYYYDSKEQPIYFSGDDTTTAGSLTLRAYQPDSAETFTLKFYGSNADGSWAYNGKTLPVKLSEASMPVRFSYHYWQDSVKLLDTLASSPQATAELSSVWPEGSSATDEFIKTQIREFLLPKAKTADIDSIFHQSASNFFEGYKSENQLTQEDIKELTGGPSRFSYEMSDDVMVCYQNSKMVVLAYTSYSYTGGAHGNYGTTYVPLDITGNKVITLSQILTSQGIQHLRPLLESSYRRANNLQPSQPLTEDGGLFENKIEPNKNFYVTSKQLVFSYVPYEISSYAVGQIDIAISLVDLQNYLQPSFKSLLQ